MMAVEDFCSPCKSHHGHQRDWFLKHGVEIKGVCKRLDSSESNRRQQNRLKHRAKKELATRKERALVNITNKRFMAVPSNNTKMAKDRVAPMTKSERSERHNAKKKHFLRQFTPNILGEIISGDDKIRIPKDPNASETSLKYYNSAASSIGRSIATMVDPTNPQRFLDAMASRKKTTPTTFTIYLDDTDTTHLKGQKQVAFTFNAVTEGPQKETENLSTAESQAPSLDLSNLRSALGKTYTHPVLQALGQPVVNMLRKLSLSRPSERRPFLASVFTTDGSTFKRKEVEAALGFEISRKEWWKSQIHAKVSIYYALIFQTATITVGLTFLVSFLPTLIVSWCIPTSAQGHHLPEPCFTPNLANTDGFHGKSRESTAICIRPKDRRNLH
jgi:hypothetical protein